MCIDLQLTKCFYTHYFILFSRLPRWLPEGAAWRTEAPLHGHYYSHRASSRDGSFLKSGHCGGTSKDICKGGLGFLLLHHRRKGAVPPLPAAHGCCSAGRGPGFSGLREGNVGLWVKPGGNRRVEIRGHLSPRLPLLENQGPWPVTNVNQRLGPEWGSV